VSTRCVLWRAAAAAPPRVVVGYRRRVDQRAGTTVRLECPVRADPTALVSWSKDGREVNIAWDRFRVLVVDASDITRQRGEVSQLRVRNATVDDSGLYVCTATNGFGTVRASFHLLIYGTSYNKDADQHNTFAFRKSHDK